MNWLTASFKRGRESAQKSLESFRDRPKKLDIHRRSDKPVKTEDPAPSAGYFPSDTMRSMSLDLERPDLRRGRGRKRGERRSLDIFEVPETRKRSCDAREGLSRPASDAKRRTSPAPAGALSTGKVQHHALKRRHPSAAPRDLVTFWQIAAACGPNTKKEFAFDTPVPFEGEEQQKRIADLVPEVQADVARFVRQYDVLMGRGPVTPEQPHHLTTDALFHLGQLPFGVRHKLLAFFQSIAGDATAKLVDLHEMVKALLHKDPSWAIKVLSLGSQLIKHNPKLLPHLPTIAGCWSLLTPRERPWVEKQLLRRRSPADVEKGSAPVECQSLRDIAKRSYTQRQKLAQVAAQLGSFDLMPLEPWMELLSRTQASPRDLQHALCMVRKWAPTSCDGTDVFNLFQSILSVSKSTRETTEHSLGIIAAFFDKSGDSQEGPEDEIPEAFVDLLSSHPRDFSTLVQGLLQLDPLQHFQIFIWTNAVFSLHEDQTFVDPIFVQLSQIIGHAKLANELKIEGMGVKKSMEFADFISTLPPNRLPLWTETVKQIRSSIENFHGRPLSLSAYTSWVFLLTSLAHLNKEKIEEAAQQVEQYLSYAPDSPSEAVTIARLRVIIG